MSALELQVAARWAWWRSRVPSRLPTRPLLAPSPRGRLRLPGITVETILHHAPDAYGRPFGLVLVPSTGHVSVTVDCAVPGRSRTRPGRGLTDDWLTDDWLASLRSWLTAAAVDPGHASAAVVIQQDPVDPAAPPRVLIQVTRRWSPSGRTDPPGVAVDLGGRLPALIRSLHRGAVGTCRPLTAGELAFVVRGAYRPSPDEAWTGGRLQWSDAAPAVASESWDALRHGAASSLTWGVHLPPGAGWADAVRTFATVPPEVARTRVTLLHGRTPPERVTVLVTVTSTPQTLALPAALAAVQARLPASLRPWLRPRYGSQAASFAAALPTGTLLAAHAAPPSLLPGPE